jgi:hypothetical protein
MVVFQLEYLVPSWTTTDTEDFARLDFCVEGEPKVQNGWKVAWKGLPFPRIYAPRAREKNALRAALKRAMAEVLGPRPPHRTFFPPLAPLIVSIRYFQDGAHDKDLDNMTKFLNDAMERAIFPDDKYIMEMHLYKDVALHPRTVVSIERK